MEIKETSKTSDFPSFHYLSDLMKTSNVLLITERGSQHLLTKLEKLNIGKWDHFCTVEVR